MSKTWNKVLELVASGDLRISEHGYEELAADRITVRDIVSNVAHADVLRRLSRLSERSVRLGAFPR